MAVNTKLAAISEGEVAMLTSEALNKSENRGAGCALRSDLDLTGVFGVDKRVPGHDDSPSLLSKCQPRTSIEHELINNIRALEIQQPYTHFPT